MIKQRLASNDKTLISLMSQEILLLGYLRSKLANIMQFLVQKRFELSSSTKMVDFSEAITLV